MIDATTHPETTTTVVVGWDGSLETRHSGLVWIVEHITREPHPDPCGHSPEIGCLNTTIYDERSVWYSKEKAKAYATKRFAIQQGEWIGDDPDGHYDAVIRVWNSENGKTGREEQIEVFSARLEPNE